MIGIQFPGTRSTTFRNFHAPEQSAAKELKTKVETVKDFFLAFDGTERDGESAPGVVSLLDEPAAGLLEGGYTATVSGVFIEASGTLLATGERQPGFGGPQGRPAKLNVWRNDGLENVFFQTDSHPHGFITGEFTSLNQNPNGTFTFATAVAD